MRTSRHMFLACVNKGVSGKREHDCLNTNKTSSILPFQAVSSKVFVTLRSFVQATPRARARVRDWENEPSRVRSRWSVPQRRPECCQNGPAEDPVYLAARSRR
jgi:hypothetical protein